MTIYPAIDIYNEKCVRLEQGNYDAQTVFSDNPVEIAKKWEQMGAKFLHIVDLNGSRQGEPTNFNVLKNIVSSVPVPVQTGGGIRNITTVEKMFDCGVSRVILGTSALREPDFVKEAVYKYGEKIAVGIDAKDGFVAVSGWEEVSTVPAFDFASQMEKLGVQYVIYTDIATDGMLKGPNVAAMREMALHTKMNVIASGGVSKIDDIIELKSTAVEGVIVGKALYTGGVNLEEVYKCL